MTYRWPIEPTSNCFFNVVLNTKLTFYHHLLLSHNKTLKKHCAKNDVFIIIKNDCHNNTLNTEAIAQKCSEKALFLKILQISIKNSLSWILFLTNYKLQVCFIKNTTPTRVFSENSINFSGRLFLKHLQVTADSYDAHQLEHKNSVQTLIKSRTYWIQKKLLEWFYIINGS